MGAAAALLPFVAARLLVAVALPVAVPLPLLAAAFLGVAAALADAAVPFPDVVDLRGTVLAKA
jgi:hypothetical protein